MRLWLITEIISVTELWQGFEELVKIFPMGLHYDKAKQMLNLIKKGTL